MGPGFRRDNGVGEILPVHIIGLSGATLTGVPA
jgi:hypothetical protein